MEGASTITLNSFNNLAIINGNDMYPIFNFGGKHDLFFKRNPNTKYNLHYHLLIYFHQVYMYS